MRVVFYLHLPVCVARFTCDLSPPPPINPPPLPRPPLLISHSLCRHLPPPISPFLFSLPLQPCCLDSIILCCLTASPY